MENNKSEIKWVSCAKFVAILAVIIDHSESILYNSTNVAMATYFSVSLFIFISGMMSYRSNQKHNLPYGKSLSRALSRIIPAYLIAVFVYQIVTIGFFDLLTYLSFVINFNICGHFYYVALYIQLMLVGWILARILKNIPKAYEILFEIVMGIIILAISEFTTIHSNIMYIYGGGGKLLGGTYLFIFYLGMLAAKHQIFKQLSTTVGFAVAFIALACTFIWCRFECSNQYALDAKFPFGDGVNPPSISTFVMMLCVLMLCYSMFSTLENIKYLSYVTNICAVLGRHTLYIFLYHVLVLNEFLNRYVKVSNIWLRRLIYITMMIAVPIVVEYIFGVIKAYIKKDN